MLYSRRAALAAGTATIAIAALGAARGFAQEAALEGDSYPVEGGAVVIHPVEHASLVMALPGMVVHVDPVGGAERYAGLPAPSLILVTHEHPDHFDVPTLTALAAGGAPLLTSPSVHDKLPAGLQAQATAIANGEGTTASGVPIAAVPAYNTTPDRLQYHPKGRDNGYVLEVGGKRFYIAGDTEDTPEMRALTGIEVAFLPMNLPYTMSIEQAASAVAAFEPGFVYPYHYKGSDPAAFAKLVADGGGRTKVVLRDWYALG
jgi:L-ascorbate metabolism protein UlaG (beta-lactamase superfamily)